VIPGANARDQIHAVPGAKLGEGAQVALIRPVELALDLLVMDPDDVGGDDIHPGGLHLEDFVFPLGARVARKMKLSGYGQPGFSVEGEIAIVQAQGES